MGLGDAGDVEGGVGVVDFAGGEEMSQRGRRLRWM